LNVALLRAENAEAKRNIFFKKENNCVDCVVEILKKSNCPKIFKIVAKMKLTLTKEASNNALLKRQLTETSDKITDLQSSVILLYLL
jgi:hypothetical protein